MELGLDFEEEEEDVGVRKVGVGEELDALFLLLLLEWWLWEEEEEEWLLLLLLFEEEW